MKIAFGADHAGVSLKDDLVALVRAAQHEAVDLGPAGTASVDYPDYAAKVTAAVLAGEANLGVLVCGTGIGMSIAANKAKGIRAALCRSEFEARMARAHNDANVLCLGQRVTGAGLAQEILKVFLTTPFEGGRHAQRVDKLAALDAGKALGLLLVAALGLFSSCRTEIVPVVRQLAPPKVFKAPPGECEVHDYDSATEVPAGAKNLGWIQVKREATDEDTYAALRKKICGAGGDALSQLAWVKEPGEREPSSLKANAWSLP